MATKEKLYITLSPEAMQRLDHMAEIDGRTWRGQPNRSAVMEDLIMQANVYPEDKLLNSRIAEAIKENPSLTPREFFQGEDNETSAEHGRFIWPLDQVEEAWPAPWSLEDLPLAEIDTTSDGLRYVTVPARWYASEYQSVEQPGEHMSRHGLDDDDEIALAEDGSVWVVGHGEICGADKDGAAWWRENVTV